MTAQSAAARTPEAPTLSVRVAEEIRAWMGRRRMTGAALSAALGVSAAWVSYRLSGKQEIGLDDLERIAEALGVPVAELLPLEVRQASRVTGRYRDQAERPVIKQPDIRPPAGDASPVRPDHNRRPRRPGHARPPIPIMRTVAA